LTETTDRSHDEEVDGGAGRKTLRLGRSQTMSCLNVVEAPAKQQSHIFSLTQVLAECRKACHGDTQPALQAGTSPLRDSNTSSAPAAVAAAR
jgi:hypothetical protein